MSLPSKLSSQKNSSDPIILIADPRILAIPVIENNEPLIDLAPSNQTTIAIGPSPEIENNTCYTKMRKTVYEKLIQAQTYLPQGIKFCLYEAYRSLELQKMLFDHRFEQTQKLHPQLSAEELFLETIKMVSPIINLDGSKNVPPHSTGAAIDVYLLDENGDALDMGIHPKDWMQDTENVLSPTHAKNISKTAQYHRQIMSEALIAVGFVNYPTEFWHWSYGDRYWAYHKNEPHAVYDTVME